MNLAVNQCIAKAYTISISELKHEVFDSIVLYA